MTTAALAHNPFSLMMEPELVLQTMERSQQLREVAGVDSLQISHARN